MHQSKLIKTLRTLSSTELSRFGKFINSPYHNENKTLIRLYNILAKCAPLYNSKKLEKERLFTRLFPEIPTYKDIKIRQALSGLLQLLEEFWAFEAYAKADKERAIKTASAYRIKGLNTYFEGKCSKIERWLNEPELSNDNDHLRLYELWQERRSYTEGRYKRGQEPHLQALNDNLDRYYCLHKVKLYCAALNVQRIRPTEYDFTLTEELIKLIRSGRFDDTKEIVLYGYASATLQDSSSEEEQFDFFLELLKEQMLNIARQEAQDLFVIARNFCIRYINKGVIKYQRIYYDICRLQIENRLFLDTNGTLTPYAYKNVVQMGLLFGELEFTKNFINDYKNKLKEEVREVIFAFCLASLHFKEKNFELIPPLLNQMEYKDMISELTSKSLLMRTYYELNEIDALYAMIDSFTVYLNRKQELINYKVNFLNFNKFMRKLLKIHLKDKKAVQSLLNEILNTKKVADVWWFAYKLKSALK